MSRQIALGKVIQVLRDKISLSYDKGTHVKVKAVIIEVTEPSGVTREVILRTSCGRK